MSDLQALGEWAAWRIREATATLQSAYGQKTEREPLSRDLLERLRDLPHAELPPSVTHDMAIDAANAGHLDLAVEFVARLPQTLEGAELANRFAEVQLKTARYEAAQERATDRRHAVISCAKAFPEDPGMLAKAAVSYAQLGDVDAAMDLARKADKRAPRIRRYPGGQPKLKVYGDATSLAEKLYGLGRIDETIEVGQMNMLREEMVQPLLVQWLFERGRPIEAVRVGLTSVTTRDGSADQRFLAGMIWKNIETHVPQGAVDDALLSDIQNALVGERWVVLFDNVEAVLAKLHDVPEYVPAVSRGQRDRVVPEREAGIPEEVRKIDAVIPELPTRKSLAPGSLAD